MNQTMPSPEHILLGFYLGIGDFLSAVPVFQRLRELGHRLTIVASPVNLQMVPLLNIADDEVDWIPFRQFSHRHPGDALKLLQRLSHISPDLAIVSPHAVGKMSSWKLPLMLRLLRLSRWRSGRVVGGAGQRMSAAFDEAVPVDFTHGLVDREWGVQQATGTIAATDSPDMSIFRPGIVARQPVYDLVIHPGASRDNKRWPVSSYVELFHRLQDRRRIAFVGLPSELKPIRDAIGFSSLIDWISGDLSAAIRTMAAARLVLTMDSGFAHVAALLNRRHIAVFGSTDPKLFAPQGGSTRVLYRRRLDCQPCNAHRCPLEGIPCMRTITAEEVAEEAITWFEASQAT